MKKFIRDPKFSIHQLNMSAISEGKEEQSLESHEDQHPGDGAILNPMAAVEILVQGDDSDRGTPTRIREDT